MYEKLGAKHRSKESGGGAAFRITDDEAYACGGACVCVTNGQLRDGTLVNRMILCGFAIVLVWASSLSVAVFIANSSISSPTADAVQGACESAFDLAKDEKADYVQCVDRQLAQCDKDFETSLNEMVAATNAQMEANAVFVEDVQHAQESCQDALGRAQAALSEWLRGGADHRVSYTCSDPMDSSCNATACGYDDEFSLDDGSVDEFALGAAQFASSSSSSSSSCTCSRVTAMVGDKSALRAAAFTTGADYTESSVGT